MSEGIHVDGVAMSLEDILANAITAVETGDESALTTALAGIETGLDNVIGEQAKQGIRS